VNKKDLLKLETPEAIGRVDAIFAAVGMEHGRRATRTGSWAGGERVRLPKASAVAAKGSRKRPGVETVPGWEKYPWLRAGFSTRLGGGSTAYSYGEREELNLGWTESDEPSVVAENRRRFLAEVAGKGAKFELAAVRQSHTPVVRTVRAEHGSLAAEDGKAVLRGDALLTDVSGLMLGVQTADCTPVIVADVKRRAVGVFHAGWRGTLKRIVERGVGAMQMEFGSRPQDLVAAVGPAIGACCYAVGEEVRFEFESQFAYAPELFSEVYDSDPVREKYPLLFLTARAPGHSNIGPQIHLDLAEANRRQLLDAGVKASRITMIGECTACARVKGGERKYFSHRGEFGFTGRMMAVVGVVGK
jgi:YfiH family protein